MGLEFEWDENKDLADFKKHASSVLEKQPQARQGLTNRVDGTSDEFDDDEMKPELWLHKRLSR
jgi:hypothetical protein